ncbi:MAG TPA: PAS domain S-box protein [Beijerinckiaceae bacterium]
MASNTARRAAGTDGSAAPPAAEAPGGEAERLRLALEATGLGFWDVDAVSGARTWSPEMRAILGVSASLAAEPAFFSTLIHPDDRDWVEAHYRRAYDPAHGGDYRAEFRIRRFGDGVERWVATTGKVSFDAEGLPVRAIGTLLDITDRKRADLALRESEERLQLALKAGGLGSWDLDLVAGQRVFSARSAEIFGVAPEEMRERGAWTRVIHPDDQERTQAALAAALKGEGDYRVEFRVCTGEGVRWVASQAIVQRGSDGAARRVIGIHQDVTEQHRAQAALRESEARFRALAEATPQLVWSTLPDGACDYLSPQWEDYTGRPAADHHGLGWQEAIHPDDRPRAAQAWALAAARFADYDVEYRLRGSDGTYRWFKARGSPLLDETGAILRWFGTSTDIDDLVRAREAMRESEQRLRATQEHAAVGIGEADAAGRLLRVNEALCSIAGASRSAMIGRVLFDRTHADDLDEDRTQYTRQVAGEIDRYGIEKRYRRDDGQEVWISVVSSAVRDAEGRFLYSVRVVQDVTERKLAEARQRLLLGELNHRVKNTLATVQSIAAQTARTATSAGSFFEAFEPRLLALSKAHNLLTQGSWEGADLRDVLEQELSPYMESAAADGPARVSLHGPRFTVGPRTALALGLAFHELSTNAAKYGALSAPEGRVAVAWRRSTIETQAWLRLTWREAGGPPVVAPTRRGFGSRLLDRGVAAELGGSVDLAFEPTGLRCRIEIPLDGEADKRML